MAIEQRFQDSEEYERLEPYVDSYGLVAGYRVERLLHRDPWRHTTYEARTPNGRLVEFKLLRSGESRRAAKRFQSRVKLRASLEHPNLLDVFGWGKLGDQYYLATALCRAPTLAELLKAGPLDTETSFRLLTQLADGLETAHEHGLVHRELSPENVFVAPHEGGHVLLGDFGVANPHWGMGLLDLAEPNSYLSPEKLRDEPLTPQSNVYSLTCILVECLTGSPPYVSDLPGAVAYAHAAEPPPRLSERSSELPKAIDEVVAAGMAKDPDERLGSARKLVAVAAESLGVAAPAPLVHRPFESSPAERARANGTSDARGVAVPTLPALERLDRSPRGRPLAIAVATGERVRRLASVRRSRCTALITHVAERFRTWRFNVLRRQTALGRRAAVAERLRTFRARPRPAMPRPKGVVAERLRTLRSRPRPRGRPAMPRPKGAVMVVVAVIAAGGALGFTLARSGPNEREVTPRVTADPARVNAERQRALLRRTDAVLARLDRGRAVARRRLDTAATRRGQAAAAAELAADYRSAGQMLPPESRAVARLESALQRAGQAYGRLARAARRGDRRGYARASGAVRRRESDLQQTIAQLNDTRLTP